MVAQVLWVIWLRLVLLPQVLLLRRFLPRSKARGLL
jgi:hypothetical protein